MAILSIPQPFPPAREKDVPAGIDEIISQIESQGLEFAQANANGFNYLSANGASYAGLPAQWPKSVYGSPITFDLSIAYKDSDPIGIKLHSPDFNLLGSEQTKDAYTAILRLDELTRSAIHYRKGKPLYHNTMFLPPSQIPDGPGEILKLVLSGSADVNIGYGYNFSNGSREFIEYHVHEPYPAMQHFRPVWNQMSHPFPSGMVAHYAGAPDNVLRIENNGGAYEIRAPLTIDRAQTREFLARVAHSHDWVLAQPPATPRIVNP